MCSPPAATAAAEAKLYDFMGNTRRGSSHLGQLRTSVGALAIRAGLPGSVLSLSRACQMTTKNRMILDLIDLFNRNLFRLIESNHSL